MDCSFTDPQTISPTLLAPSKYVFHPIIEVTTQGTTKYCDALFKGKLEDEATEVTYSTSFENDDDADACSLDMDFLTPYPAYTKTSEEIQEFKELELSLGENWSLHLAGELSSCDMSVDETIETEFEEDDIFGMDDEDDTTAEESAAVGSTQSPKQDPDEIDEIRRKRNLLWKQSLKFSMFTPCR